jgi:hypothetical protein
MLLYLDFEMGGNREIPVRFSVFHYGQQGLPKSSASNVLGPSPAYPIFTNSEHIVKEELSVEIDA